MVDANVIVVLDWTASPADMATTATGQAGEYGGDGLRLRRVWTSSDEMAVISTATSTATSAATSTATAAAHWWTECLCESCLVYEVGWQARQAQKCWGDCAHRLSAAAADAGNSTMPNGSQLISKYQKRKEKEELDEIPSY
ncbi:tRNA (guanine-N(1)-)-methyltransferase [Striga asiatica]|uniref:tRNA (Guanine-N(1)-)-methyltransferase n=1 Tax=Striga asiatica TaxID=4170 RepID=A0A5A7PIW3_STRAF|nr:tRNA (guanine-N(1)-)-methyltransferase [Striga asiatica]